MRRNQDLSDTAQQMSMNVWAHIFFSDFVVIYQGITKPTVENLNIGMQGIRLVKV